MIRSGNFSERRYVRQSLRHYWRVNLAVLLGMTVGAAVLTGALLVGDSVRQSLRTLTLERLGRIDQVLIADHFFRTELADSFDLGDTPLPPFTEAVPGILLNDTTVERGTGDGSQRATSVTLVGHDGSFWKLDARLHSSDSELEGRQIVLNEPLAESLGAKIGDRVIVRLPKASGIAGDSPLGEKSDRVQSLAELEVVAIVPARGLGRFSLRANQALPRTAFLPLDTLQDALEQDGRVNAVFIGSEHVDQHAADTAVESLKARLRPSLVDAGLRLKPVELNFQPAGSPEIETTFRYLSLSTDTMMFSPSQEGAIERAMGELAAETGITFSPVMTYLANGIRRPGREPVIAYSTVAAVTSEPGLTPLTTEQGEPIGPLGSDEIVLNSWAAEQLGASPGDEVALTYFAPETTHGEPEERSATFRLKAVVPLTKPATPYRRNRPARYTEEPTRANDPDLTPEVPGITDQESIDAWDPPFPFDYDRIRKPEDEDYWDEYRTTPKAYVSKETGDRLWGSRFGDTTSFRITWQSEATEMLVRDKLERIIAENPAAFGITFLPVKAQGMAASRGTTPFNLLFLGFSFFIIAAALMLVSLLFRLNLEQRAKEAGLLMAVGLSQHRVTRLFLFEGLLLSVLGAIAGTLGGIGYAALMIAGLRTWWLDAVVTPFLELHITPTSLVSGAIVGLLTSLLTIRLTVAGLRQASLQGLLQRQIRRAGSLRARRQGLVTSVAGLVFLLAIGAGLAAAFLQGEAQAGAFFGGGAGVLVASLLLISQWLKRPARPEFVQSISFNAGQFVLRNIGRHPGRSTLTVGLMATACFLIVAISAFRLAPTEQGTGGFPLLAESDVPIFEDLNDLETRRDLLGPNADALSGTRIYALRRKAGDDASCRNLYQAQRPQLLGMTSDFIRRYDPPTDATFGWAASSAPEADEPANPWRALERSADDWVPVILDKNTAMYSLHLYRGLGEEFEINYGEGKTIRFRVVGLLAGSVFQGSLLISEAQLLQHFPEVSGYQFFAMDCPLDAQVEVARILEDRYRDQGWQNTDTRRLLADLMAVQNTYLSTFQSLGGLGLLLGTFGLVAVQLRNVFERRDELALLRACGFSQRRLGRLILTEHFALLMAGLGVGVLAALLAVIPHAWTTQIRPPWETLLAVLTVILAVGLITGYLALRPVTRAPLVEALRGQ